jgi:hypothetical protein
MRCPNDIGFSSAASRMHPVDGCGSTNVMVQVSASVLQTQSARHERHIPIDRRTGNPTITPTFP